MRFFRLLKIFRIVWYYRLDDLLLAHLKSPYRGFFHLFKHCSLGRLKIAYSPEKRLRCALEALGPIFVKFGQVLSTRQDLLPKEMIGELQKLQDDVLPFDTSTAIAMIERALGASLEAVFSNFRTTPIASASIAQVYKAQLKNPQLKNPQVAIKVLRPDIMQIIEQDIALMNDFARLIEYFWIDGKRLKPKAVIAEFDQSLHDELDLMREAANACQLRRNFLNSPLLKIPEIYWDYTRHNVLVMEYMRGIPINQIERLKAANIDLKKLAHEGVQLFFTQFLRDGFFHADMHPGNIQVSADPETRGCYIALDFGIVGTLSDFDKHYLAQNFLAFFQRDYHRVAALHVESGWVPRETRIESLESAIRACCEPCFNKPLKEISLGFVLMRLFQTSRRFKVEIQPQLVLLQKTLLNIESLGRALDPNLDLWETAKPLLERWVRRQMGLRGWLQQIQKEASQWHTILPKIPRLSYQVLLEHQSLASSATLKKLLIEQRKTNRLSIILLFFLAGLIIGIIGLFLWVLFAKSAFPY